MELLFFLKGCIIGFSIAAPVGPIGVLCIKRTLHSGRLAGLFSGLGAALADAFYGMIAAFGLSAVANLLLSAQWWLRIVGGLFLIYLGVKIFLEKPKSIDSALNEGRFIKNFTSTFGLTLTNPMTIFSFMAVFAGLGLGSESKNFQDASLLVLGVFIGSCFWWLLLSELVTLFRKKISKMVFLWINRLAGILIFLFGIAAFFY